MYNNNILIEEKLSVVKQQALLLANEKGLKVTEQRNINELKDSFDNNMFKWLESSLKGMTDAVVVSYCNDGTCNCQLFWTLNKYRTWRKVYKFLLKQKNVHTCKNLLER